MTNLKTGRPTDYAVAIVFLLAIGLPFIGSILVEDKGESAAEKRTLTVLPERPRSKKELKIYPGKYTDYYQDNFGFREELLGSYNRLKIRIGDSPSVKVIRGKDGWLFFRGSQGIDPVNSFRGIRRFTEPELRQFARAFMSCGNQPAMVDSIIEGITSSMSASRVGIYLHNKEGQHYELCGDFKCLDKTVEIRFEERDSFIRYLYQALINILL